MERKFFYSIYDGRAKMYMDPFVAFNDAIAMRDFERNCMDGAGPLSLFSDDYSLVRLGTFGILDGVVVSEDGPLTICKASVFKKSE